MTASFRSPLVFALVATFAPALLACGSSNPAEESTAYQSCLKAQRTALLDEALASPKEKEAVALVEVDGTKLHDAVKERLKREAHFAPAYQRANLVANLRCEPLKPKPTGPIPPGAAMSADSSGAASKASEGASQVSGTNNQVAGVDEADFIKNDNKYIYLVNDEGLRIVEAWPAESMRIVGRASVKGKPKKLFVTDTRAVVFSSDVPTQGSSSSKRGSYGYGSSECTYGYDCVNVGDGTPTLVSIFDLTDKGAPKLLRELRTSGSLIAARRVGNMIHTVVTQLPPATLSNGYYGSQTGAVRGSSEAAIDDSYRQIVAAIDKAIDETPVNVVVPALEEGGQSTAAAHAYASDDGVGAAFTSVLSLDLGSGSSNMVSVLGNPGVVYASAESLYVASQPGFGRYFVSYGYGSVAQRTSIHKFAIGASADATAYRASGTVKGRPLNQFALDDQQGFLRIATTTGQAFDKNAHSTLSVLEQQGAGLAVVGAVDGIAKSEDIRSVRFDGDRAYVVTFKKTDPLFTFDLSNPRAPRMLGELKIPGFSTYMQMMDDRHLLTIGYDADDKGSFAYFTGVMLQIFDVTDPTAPTLKHKELIGTRGSSSEALTNHLAFTYFAPKNLLALPMTVCEGGDGNGNYGTKMTFSGLIVWDVTAQSGFHQTGRVSHPNTASCSNWWTQASSQVKRSIVMDDVVFSVSDSRIKANRLGALDTAVAEVLTRSTTTP